MKVILIANNAPKNIKEIIDIEKDDFVIAIDGGFDLLLKQKIEIDLIIGDLDSIKNKNKLGKYEKLKLKSEKDETDTYVAVDYAYTLGNKVYLIGGIQGDRIEHFLANINLFNKFPELMILDNNSKIYLLDQGKHILRKNGYHSFFAYDNSVISLDGFKYPLTKYELNKFDSLAISNEVVNLYGELTIHKGRVIVIESKRR